MQCSLSKDNESMRLSCYTYFDLLLGAPQSFVNRACLSVRSLVGWLFRQSPKHLMIHPGRAHPPGAPFCLLPLFGWKKTFSGFPPHSTVGFQTHSVPLSFFFFLFCLSHSNQIPPHFKDFLSCFIFFFLF